MSRGSWIAIFIIVAAAIGIALALNARRDPEPAAAAPTITTTTTTTATTPPTAPTTSTSVQSSSTLSPGASACDPYQSVEVAGTIESDALVETSGIAASRTAPGVIWAHNDSGDDPRIYAVGSDGRDLGSFTLEGGLAFDWEDIAVGPGPEPGTSYLYVGDIGDNFAIREGRVSVYRLPEPNPEALDDAVPVEASLILDSPDGPHDFESLFVADDSIYLVTKDGQPARVYRSVLGATDTLQLELVATADLGAEVTAADVSWDGSTVAFRGYSSIWMWHRPAGTTVAEALAGEPCEAPSPDESQGEALTFLSDGSVVTASEGSNPALNLLRSER